MEKYNETQQRSVRELGYIADRENVINPLWNSFSTMDSYDSITNQMLLMEKYEQALGIQPACNAFPISLATMNEHTDPYHNSMLEKTMLKLMRMKAPETTGMSLKALLALPTYELKMIIHSLTILRSETPTTKKELDDLVKGLNIK